MTPRALLESATHDTFLDDEGVARRIKLIPPGRGLNEHEFRKKFKGPIPPDMQELYALASGFELHSSEVQFTEYHIHGYNFLFEEWLEIVADGFGNHWVLEIRPGAESWGPVWFTCHDPPVVLHVAEDLATFLRYFLDAHRGGRVHNLFTCSHGDADQLVGINPRWPIAAELRSTTDPILARLIAEVPDNAEIIDLRTGPRGFVWQSHDTSFPAHRGAHPLLFAMLPE